MHGEITRVMSDAANSVMPAFARTQADADSALDKFNAEMQTNPAVVLIKQKIAAEQEMRNKKIDQMDDGRRAVSCGL
jgi:ATP-dependent protease HslVU (ClpYQ) peptidase subunit